jgi:hypothetical protein
VQLSKTHRFRSSARNCRQWNAQQRLCLSRCVLCPRGWSDEDGLRCRGAEELAESVRGREVVGWIGSVNKRNTTQESNHSIPSGHSLSLSLSHTHTNKQETDDSRFGDLSGQIVAVENVNSFTACIGSGGEGGGDVNSSRSAEESKQVSRLSTMGGGGFGKPKESSPDRNRDDHRFELLKSVRCGFVVSLRV